MKHFDPNHAFTQQETDRLINLAMRAPSSFNIQHWRLVKVVDKALRAELRAAANNQAQVTDASLLFVVTVDIKAWAKNPARYWANAPKEAQDILVPWIHPFYSGKEQLQRDEAMRSAGIMLQTMMLSAKAMGYDSCPMVGFDFDKVAKLIHLPKDYAIAAMLVIGKGIKPAWPKPGFIPKSEMIIENHF
ncbi:MAG: nitroreductase family protein [Ottowia sp.]|nr:nitroreductase family protein [Ottowia sp.]